MFLSIIIPVYNCEKYIEECLCSIVKQDISTDDYEILCINDGSSDNSGEIIYKYTKSTTNLIYKEQINKGVSAARNLGLRSAQGKYIWFVDADDIVAPNCFSKLKTIGQKNDFDRIQVASYVFINELSSEEKVMAYKGQLKSNYPYKEVMVTRTLYKKEYLIKNNISFLEGVDYGEDGVFNYQSLIHSPQTYESSIVAYYYRKHNNSLTGKPREQTVKKCLSEAPIIFDIIVKDYNSRVSILQSRRMLIYWMYAVIDEYSFAGKECFNSFIWNYRLIIPIKDFELRKLDRQFQRLAKHHNYDELLYLAKKYSAIRKKAEKNRIRKKRIIGCFRHPKRLIKMLKKS